ncbi:MAG: hypothetical protein E7591_01385 [Ruminococcaceae bacterium]|nr:hypothetical protein [Oscillospiraceae bacterium]
MKTLYRIIICLVLVFCLVTPTVFAFDNDLFNKTYTDTKAYLKSLGTPSVGSVGGEWLVIALTRDFEECPDGYYENVVEFVNNKINEKGQLHKSKSTDNSRIILGLTAAGYDPRNVGGHDLIFGLTDITYLKKQGPNGTIWALIALDCNNYEIPENPDAAEQTTREGLIAVILSNQLTDGGWAMSGKNADPDMTGMAIQALAPYYDTNDDVKSAVDKALTVLSEKQHDNGGYGSVDGACSESCAQVIVALTSMGIDPTSDARFIKNSKTVIDAILEFAVEGGGFSHVPGAARNGMATEQAQYALVAYKRFTEGKNTLYDMSEEDIKIEDEKPEDDTITDKDTEDSVKDESENETVPDTENNKDTSDKNGINAEKAENDKSSSATSSGTNNNKINQSNAKPQTGASTGTASAQTGDPCIFISLIVLAVSLIFVFKRRGSRV